MRHDDPEFWRGLVKMGLTKLFMLRALAVGPSHGYELAKRTEALSEGICTPTEGTIYPVLRAWEEEGLVVRTQQVVQGRQRRIYGLTSAGRTALDTAQAAWMPAARTLVATSVAYRERLDDHLL